MTEEMKLLLRILLEQEDKKEAPEKETAHKLPKRTPTPTEGLDYPPEEITLPKEKKDHIQKEYLSKDVSDEMKKGLPEHSSENIITHKKEVPIWEKYALTRQEAAAYFHIGQNKLSAIINSDKYAEYLIWSGGHCFIKRKMFEEYLNKTNSV